MDEFKEATSATNKEFNDAILATTEALSLNSFADAVASAEEREA